jgi:hypothetical protein
MIALCFFFLKKDFDIIDDMIRVQGYDLTFRLVEATLAETEGVSKVQFKMVIRNIYLPALQHASACRIWQIEEAAERELALEAIRRDRKEACVVPSLCLR